MSLKLALAAVLRVLRGRKGLSQEGLAQAASRTYLATLERGESSVSLDKLYLLSNALDLSPMTLLALTLSTCDDEPLEAILSRMTKELTNYEQSGLLNELKSQLQGDALVARNPGKRVDLEKLRQVRQCKAEGLTQKLTAEKVGLSKQTVHDMWHRKTDQ